MIGFGFNEFFVVHISVSAIGHFAHSNLDISIGPFKYIFNNPQFHVWHHAKKFPGKYGVNFGLSLSLWDWLFNTAYLPAHKKAKELGIPDDKDFPKGFFGQIVYPFYKKT
jgi:sterol desaturase/sphingolipid hydroxylase (fatty acid hydroxylase superfamily)